MTTTLNYAPPANRRYSREAILSMILALLSGPLQVCIVFAMASHFFPSSWLTNEIAMPLVLAPPIITFILNIAAGIRILATPSLKGLFLPILGTLASLTWPLALLIYALNHLPTC